MPKQEANNASEQRKKPAVEPKDDTELVVKEDVTTLAPAAAAPGKKKFDFKAFLRTKKGKTVAAIVAIVLVVAVVFTVPASRYAVAGLIIKKDVTVELIDSETAKPVSAADVTLGGQAYKTDANGKVTFKSVAVGNWPVSSKKNYYQDAKTDTLVPILRNPDTVKLSVVATGRQVPVVVTNKIAGKPLGGVAITANDATATTTDNGEATLVLPADKQMVNATFKISGYNDLAADITVTEQLDDKNKFAMTPAGKVYFLSKRTGKVDVMSSNLDGSDQKVVVAATGKETEMGNEPELAVSADWKHVILKARRDSDVKLYAVSVTDGKLTVIDEGVGLGFDIAGWTGDSLVYKLHRPTVKMWEPKRFSIKAYNATTQKITTLDDTEGQGVGPHGWMSQIYGFVKIVDGRAVMLKYWETAGMEGDLNNKRDQLITVKPDGSDKKVAKDFFAPWTKAFETRANTPRSFYLRVINHVNPQEFYEYTADQVHATTAVDANNFYSNTVYFVPSPSDKQTAWQEYRDTWVVLVGDDNGANGTVALNEPNYSPVAWYTDEYILLYKDSAVYIYPAKPSSGVKPQKITELMSLPYVNAY